MAIKQISINGREIDNNWFLNNFYKLQHKCYKIDRVKITVDDFGIWLIHAKTYDGRIKMYSMKRGL